MIMLIYARYVYRHHCDIFVKLYDIYRDCFTFFTGLLKYKMSMTDHKLCKTANHCYFVFFTAVVSVYYHVVYVSVHRRGRNDTTQTLHTHTHHPLSVFHQNNMIKKDTF